MNPIVVAFTGLKQSGKDSAAQTLIEKGFNKVAFAGGLKKVCAEMLGVQVELFESEEFKSSFHGPSGVTYRTWLQYIGTEGFRNLWPDVHIDWLNREILNKEYKAVVITDLRFPNELEMLTSNFNTLSIRIVKPRVENSDGHESEKHINDLKVDVEIVNDSSLQDLWYKVLVEVNRRFHLTREDILRFKECQ